MGSTFAGIEIARRALNTNQGALNVVGHNLANVNTPGYSRQTPIIVAAEPYSYDSAVWHTNPGQVGTGVDLKAVVRARDEFVEQRLLLSDGERGELQHMRDILENIQSSYGEPSTTGLSGLLTAFFNAFQELSRDPESTAVRTLVREKGNLLAAQFRAVSGALIQTRLDAQQQVATIVKEANSVAKQVAELNARIAQSVVIGENPNDLQDSRDALIRRLGELVGAEVKPELDGNGRETGAVNVFVGGHSLVLRDITNALPTDFTTLQGEPYLTDGSQDIPLRGGAAAGEIRGINLIDGYRNDLNTLASSLITAVNQFHQAGYGLDGLNNRVFFTGSDAGDIAVNPAIVADLNVIAAASPPPAGGNLAPGNGDNARAIANIIQQRLLNNQTLSEYYASGLAKIGSDTRAIDSRMNHLEQMRQQLQSLRNAVSGVSIDEELTLMLQYQRSYQAAARMLTVMDEVLDRIINSLVR